MNGPKAKEGEWLPGNPPCFTNVHTAWFLHLTTTIINSLVSVCACTDRILIYFFRLVLTS